MTTWMVLGAVLGVVVLVMRTRAESAKPTDVRAREAATRARVAATRAREAATQLDRQADKQEKRAVKMTKKHGRGGRRAAKAATTAMALRDAADRKRGR
jgi:hypothetical protein